MGERCAGLITQENLTKISEWTAYNRMMLKESKTDYSVIARKRDRFFTRCTLNGWWERYVYHPGRVATGGWGIGDKY